MLGTLKTQLTFLLCIGATLIFFLIGFNWFNDEQSVNTGPFSLTFQAFYNCMQPRLLPLRGKYDKFWQEFVNLTLVCDDLDVYKLMNIKSVNNSDETKWLASPVKNHKMTMVTLGIGKDTGGEEALKSIHPETEFFGADPSSEINQDLYTKIGTYFPIAVSASGGLQTSHVYRETYENEVTLHVGADYFFDQIIKKKRIDILWIDTEGNEYPMVELLHNGSKLDQLGIKICQINIEFHLKTLNGFDNEHRIFHDFVWKLLSDGKYVMLKPFNVYNGFIRTFLVNVQDTECTKFYIRG